MNHANNTGLCHIMKREGGILSRQLGTTVCSEIDFYEFINRIIKLLENLVCGNVPSIYTSLPMMELDLISELEKEMNMIGRHEEVILVDSEDFFDGLEFFKSLEKLRIEEWGLEGRIKRERDVRSLFYLTLWDVSPSFTRSLSSTSSTLLYTVCCLWA